MQSVEELNTSENASQANEATNTPQAKKNKAGHSELTKRQKTHISVGMAVIVPLLLIILYNSFSDDEVALENIKKPVMAEIETKPGKVTPEQKERIQASIEIEKEALVNGEQTTPTQGIFDIAVKKSPTVGNSQNKPISLNDGVAFDTPVNKKVETEVKSEVSSNLNSSNNAFEAEPETKPNRFSPAGGQNNNAFSNSRNAEDQKNKIAAFKRINDRHQLKSLNYKVGNNLTHQMYDNDNEKSTNQNSLTSNNSSSGSILKDKKTQSDEGKGRGFVTGDIILATTRNGLNSTNESKFLSVDIVHGPLEGARMIFTPKVSYDTYVFEAIEIQLGKNRAPIKAIIVTPDANVPTGYRSDVNYHTLYKLGMLWVYGASKGAAELVNNFSNNVSKDNDTTIVTSDYGTTEIIISAFGGAADAATDLIKEETTKPPTVTVNRGDTVGVMFVEAFNPQWLKVVDDSEYSL